MAEARKEINMTIIVCKARRLGTSRRPARMTGNNLGELLRFARSIGLDTRSIKDTTSEWFFELPKGYRARAEQAGAKLVRSRDVELQSRKLWRTYGTGQGEAGEHILDATEKMKSDLEIGF